MSEQAQQNSREHILVCLSSAPSNEKIIKIAADMAKAYGAKLTALFVETADFANASAENKERVEAHIKLAVDLGAEVETAFGEDIAYQIAKFSEKAGITKLVLGRSTFTKKRLFQRSNIVEQLLSYAPDIDIHIIPDKAADIRYFPSKSKKNIALSVLKDVLISAVCLGASTLLSYLLSGIGVSGANLIMAYILGVLIVSVATSNVAYSLVSSVAAVFLFNYLFTEPQFSLSAYETGYPFTFFAMFITAFVTAFFAQTYKKEARQSAKVARRLKLLFDANRQLSAADSKRKILDVAAAQLSLMFNCNVIIFDDESNETLYAVDNAKKPVYDSKIESLSADSAINNKTEGESGAHFKYYPLTVNSRNYGAVGLDKKDMTAFEHDSLMTVLLECALALENEKNSREKEEAAIVARTEKLRANILRSLSHDLRTPLTSISGNAVNLIENSNRFDEETKLQIYRDIDFDARWLIDLVENLLASTRIEEGRLQLKLADELMSDIVDAAYNYSLKRAEGRKITLDNRCDMLFVKADAKLIVQVIVNLVDNAVKYTKSDSKIVLSACREGDKVRVRVADDGDGVASADVPHIFDMFYQGGNKSGDGRRSLGLGLYLCKAIVEAHNGSISYEDNVPSGAAFTFELPLVEVQINEETVD